MLARALAGALLLSQVACMTMRPVDSPSAFLVKKSPATITVITNSGTATQVATPKVLTDTIFGFNAEGDDVTIPVSDVQQLYARQVSVGRTVLLGIAVTAATAFLATAVLGLGDDKVGDKLPGDDLDDFRDSPRLRPVTRTPIIRIGIPW